MKQYLSPIRFRTWGITIGKLNVVWWDLWEKRPCFEVTWGRL